LPDRRFFSGAPPPFLEFKPDKFLLDLKKNGPKKEKPLFAKEKSLWLLI
jgi:hypothetical protein